MKILKKNGFSLLELMIAIALMAIISAFAAPKMADYMAERRLRGAARMVMSDLMMARQRAVSQNNAFRVIFTGDHTYTILDDDNGNGASDAGEASEVKDIQTDYYDVTFGASANPTFSSRGTATLGTTITLTSSRTGEARYVKVAATGRVMIDTAP
jgi:type IV fimbrial biogenesis protein FimT